MKSVYQIYKSAKVGNEKDFYCTLRQKYEEEIKNDKGNVDIGYLKTYLMKCSNRKFSELYISFTALLVSFITLITEKYDVKILTSLLMIMVVITTVLVIYADMREKMFANTLFVLNDIEQELEDKKRENQNGNSVTFRSPLHNKLQQNMEF